MHEPVSLQAKMPRLCCRPANTNSCQPVLSTQNCAPCALDRSKRSVRAYCKSAEEQQIAHDSACTHVRGKGRSTLQLSRIRCYAACAGTRTARTHQVMESQSSSRYEGVHCMFWLSTDNRDDTTHAKVHTSTTSATQPCSMRYALSAPNGLLPTCSKLIKWRTGAPETTTCTLLWSAWPEDTTSVMSGAIDALE